MDSTRFLSVILVGLILASVAMAAPVPSASATATFVGSDTKTEGNWRNVYGTDGYAIANGSQNIPVYASFTPQNQLNYTWASSTSDVRAPQTGTGLGRIASCWYNYPSFSLDLNLTDGNTHQIALYALDWDSPGGARAESIQIVDANNSNVLDTENLSNYQNGVYLIWKISGHVTINVNWTGGSNGVISGVFFGGQALTSPTGTAANFAQADTTTQGNWAGKYGVDGYSIPNGSQNIPAYASFAPQKQLNYTWASSTTDIRALQTGTGSGRIASAWYNSPGFSYDVNITDGNVHQIALYALDWDSPGGARAETIQIVDANNPNSVLDSESLSNYQNGVYLIWNISGHVKINVNWTGGSNAVISGVFFGAAQAQTTSAVTGATFAQADTTTQGNWPGKYGVDGYAIPNAGQSIPSYAVFVVQNQLNYTWAGSTSDARALRTPGGGGAIASTWYNNPTFNFDINLTDGKAHQIALYALDWDSPSGARAETIQIVNQTTGAVLDTRSISGFTGGMYLIWNVSGHVRVNVTRTAGANAVISGIFFGGSTSPANNISAPAVVTVNPPAALTVTNSPISTLTVASAQPATTSTGAALPSGLVLHWTFDTANISGTTVTDTSNHGGTGTMYGNPVPAAGQVNQALTFNGVNSYVSMPAASDMATTFNSSITLAAWIKTTNSSRVESIISKFSASGAGYIFRTNPNGTVAIAFGADDLLSYPGGATDTTKINDGQWHHVLLVVNMGQNVQFYIDGRLSSTSSVYTAPGGDGYSDLEVGSCSYTPYAGYFTGGIDDVQVYNRALTASEANSVYLLGGGQAKAPTTQTQTVTAQIPTASAQLSVSPATFGFGGVNVGTTVSTVISASNVGSSNITISNVTVAGAGFNATGLSGGAILTPGQAASLTVTFTPAVAGSASGSVAIASNASNSSALIGISGAGVQPPPVQHSVMVSWSPSSSTGIVGYSVYRGTVAGGPYTLLTTSPIAATSYTDAAGQVGQTYYYVVTSVDSNGVQSSYSNVVSATIP